MRRQQGLSLIELMISITLGLVLMTGVVQMFLTSRATFSTQQAMSRIQEGGRLGMEFIARDIRMSGFMGCPSRSAGENIENGLVGGGHLAEFDVSVEGYTDENYPLAGGAVEIRENTDVLVIRRASFQSTPIINNTGEDAEILVTGTVDDSGEKSCTKDFCDGDIVVLSSCTEGIQFKITGMEEAATNEVRLLHDVEASGDPPTNLYEDLGGKEFVDGAEILKMNTIAYFVGPSQLNPNTFSLWQDQNGELAEMIEGVENLDITYAVPAGGGYDYKEASEISGATEWSNVAAVRVELLLQSREDNVLAEPQPYTFGGTEYTSADDIGDRRMRQVFVNTIGIRSRLD